MTSNRTLWILQIVFGLYFLGVGITHFVLPDGLPGPMGWMYDLSDTQHLLAGTAEILGGLGLILPGAFKIMPKLTTLAAEGLVLVMIGAIIFHAGRGEFVSISQNVVLAAILAFIAYGRTKTPLAA